MLPQEREKIIESIKRLPTAGIEIGLALERWDSEAEKIAEDILKERMDSCRAKRSNNTIIDPKGISRKKNIITLVLCSVVILMGLVMWIFVLRS